MRPLNYYGQFTSDKLCIKTDKKQYKNNIKNDIKTDS